MQVVGVQFDIAWENKEANFETVRRLLHATPSPRHSLVVLPEMFATGFSMATDQIAESYGGATEQFLSATARQLEVTLIGGAAMRGRDGRVRNKALVFSPDGMLLAFYAKMKPFTVGGEASHYTPGEHPTVFAFGGGSVATFVCYDLRFPELFRQAALRARPELYTVIANWPEKRLLHWVRLLQARAIENQAYVIGVNRIGTDPHSSYAGRSLIVDPQGEILVDGGPAECCISAQLDIAALRSYREGLPFLDDLQP